MKPGQDPDPGQSACEAFLKGKAGRDRLRAGAGPAGSRGYRPRPGAAAAGPCADPLTGCLPVTALE